MDDLEGEEAEDVDDVVGGLGLEVEREVDKVSEAFGCEKETGSQPRTETRTKERRTFAEGKAGLAALRVVSVLVLGHVLCNLVGRLGA